MNHRVKKMIASAFLMSSVVNNTMSVKERARMFEQQAAQEAQMADQREMQRVGKLENKYGYTGRGGAVTADFARDRGLSQVRSVAEDIERRSDLNTARDIVGLVARNKQRAQRGERELEPMAAHRPHVLFLVSKLEGLPEAEQIEILNIIQSELAIKAANAIE